MSDRDDLLDLDDRDLLRRHVAGDPDAFTVLAQRHADRMWAIALRTTGHREDAADAVQDALISAYRNASSFRGDSAVTSWLHRIVVNACLDRMRRARVRPWDPLPDSGDDPRATQVSPDAAEIAVANASAAEVVDALRGLPEEQRVALVLVDAEGYSVAEAAAMVGVPVGTIKSRCSRGRARLAVTLAHLRPGVAARRAPAAPAGGRAEVPPPGGNPGTATPVQAPEGGGRSSKGGTA